MQKLRGTELEAYRASTGPRSFERGIIIKISKRLTQGQLQRGRALSNAEFKECRRDFKSGIPVASTGPRSFERGIQRPPPMLTPAQHASTGPRSFERGILLQCDSAARRRIRFNGAALFRTRNSEPYALADAEPVSLQRGRALSNAEFSGPRFVIFPPIPLQRGRALSNAELSSRRSLSSPWRALQRGRALSNAELTILRAAKANRESRFNGAALFRTRN